MLARTKYLLLEYGLYISCITLLMALLIYSYNKNLILEEKLVRVNNELHAKQVTFEKRQKEYFEKVEQHQAELEHMLKEIKSRR